MSAAPEFTETPLFTAGADGYHTYRIPTLLRSASGTLLAFCEGRKSSGTDHGDIDIVLRRSTDGGQTWGPLAVIQEEGDTAPVTIGNPVPVLDESNGHIHLLFCRNNTEAFHSVSTDDGLTWSPRKDITPVVKREGWGWIATGPVHGIQLKRGAQAGRLLIPCDHRIGTPGKDKGPFGVQAVYSDDHGATWQLGATMQTSETVAPNENTCVELVSPAPGGGSRVYFNARDHVGPHARAAAISNDGGSTWLDGGFTDAPNFTCPVVQGCLQRLRATDQGDPANRILFTCPQGDTRAGISIWSSKDEATTWAAPKLIYEGPSAYSDMAVTGPGKVAMVYEKGQAKPYEMIAFARFNEEWLDAPAKAGN
ncbi:sialidase family protein [Haloferula sp. BvORR071]|uniref:sialidase family protein n=1 Tax=Haloferula sp. BvORR071 TaxID=1396141 RepID=UPI000695EE8A|nr:sialidase family protein [Haloferula sp. BvORR071]